VSIQSPTARVELASILSQGFGSASRKRGDEYFCFKRVEVRAGSSTELSAVVKGSEPYEVLLKVSGNKLAVSCTCPHFLDHGYACKHLWAAILTADEQNYLADAVSATGITHKPGQIAGDQRADLPPAPVIITPARPAVTPIKSPPPQPGWKIQMGRVASVAASYRKDASPWPAHKEIFYILDIPKSQAARGVVLTIATGERKEEGGWKSIPRPFSIHRDRLGGLPLLEDRELLSMLLGGEQYSAFGYLESYDRGPTTFSLSSVSAQTLLPRVLQTGRCLLPMTPDERDKSPLQWDDGEPWRFVLEVRGSQSEGWRLGGGFRRGSQRLGIDEPLLVVPGGFLFTRERVAKLAEDETFPWIAGLSNNNAVVFSEQEREEFFSHLICSHALPLLDLPGELQYEEVTLSPRKCLKISQNRFNQMRAELWFEYGARSVAAKDVVRGTYEASTRRFFRRDMDAEKAAWAQLSEVGLRYIEDRWVQDAAWNVTASKLPRVVRALVESGWHVTAEGKVFRQAGKSSVSISSGVDWFELHGAIEYGDSSAPLPQLLAALKRGETMVTLGDGSYGLLPEEWLSRFGPVAAMGEAEGDHIRFRSNQSGVLDALLATQPTVNCDETFRRVRQELAQFQSISAAPQPAGFQGRLRDYQREGLGWMHFLRQFSFGGCLADDMGVGKTAQVLALLETRRELRAEGKVDAPSLVVVPKSLIFNWKQEVERFTPQVRVLDYTGIGRNKDDLSAYDLILTTYGTLRRDALHFKDQVFDYVILDEAQAVKNARTESAKAVRLLRGDHRLALSGTPVENHLGELWSLLDFLNPGMLGASSVFQLAGGAMRNPSDDARKMLAHALRPFLLRRTKEQVATELPPKIEQTIYCEMEPRQRTLYNELREHYRKSLLPKINTDGIAKSKIQVLEALLRLRQAACHPGLIDRKHAQDPSAKLDVLIEQLRAVLEEGHKALVFSQFTSLLGILRKALEKDGIEHEYLDGKTVDRQARVERFQNDPECPLFLISLKAGGVGLNLTAADYVFILDPWWNPAVEAQAVDRTHRIGQLRQVFAYRLITRDTVEEKVLELQQTKRGLADAILGAENSLIRDLRREDIELLLS
jgi:SNF2-related domain/Helicase conserved C-terminal domain/Bacterial SNF2 helicase associated/SWIM zinc finger